VDLPRAQESSALLQQLCGHTPWALGKMAGSSQSMGSSWFPELRRTLVVCEHICAARLVI